MGSALGGVAFGESQVSRYLAEGPRGLDPSLALAVFCGAASCKHRDRVRVHRPTPPTR